MYFVFQKKKLFRQRIKATFNGTIWYLYLSFRRMNSNSYYTRHILIHGIVSVMLDRKIGEPFSLKTETMSPNKNIFTLPVWGAVHLSSQSSVKQRLQLIKRKSHKPDELYSRNKTKNKQCNTAMCSVRFSREIPLLFCSILFRYIKSVHFTEMMRKAFITFFSANKFENIVEYYDKTDSSFFNTFRKKFGFLQLYERGHL